MTDRPMRPAAVVAKFPEVRYIHLALPITAKAMRSGTACSRRTSNLVLFTDADLSSPIEEVDKLIAALEAMARRRRSDRALFDAS